jgi:bis(5'-nucleosyl)-tetraphosphatase (symmetrical)
MSTYVVGDIQGCYDELRRLLDRIGFDPNSDRLWFVGDLVNRGPGSLEVLRWVKALGDRARVVLGNHDLHLLTAAAGLRQPGRKDTLAPVLRAPDCDELVHWLRHRPLLHVDTALGFVMLHAGLPPQWELSLARACAAEVEAALRGPDHRTFLAEMYGNEPACWRPGLTGHDRLRFTVNCLTRLRWCTADGTLRLEEKALPGAERPDLLPWFRVAGRRSAGERIIFGHWSTLGLLAENNVWCTDTGCVWGGRLTVLRLHPDGPDAVFSEECRGHWRPG